MPENLLNQQLIIAKGDQTGPPPAAPMRNMVHRQPVNLPSLSPATIISSIAMYVVVQP